MQPQGVSDTNSEQLKKQFRWDDIYQGWDFLRVWFCIGVICALVLESVIGVSWADDFELDEALPTDLTELSLEELMGLEITSVSKKAEKLSEAAAAIYVITPEDIRRSGVRSIPEALRMVPGLQVSRIDANKWAISSHGFTGRFANKLLVLIDGRSVYTPLFSGVYWDVQDTMLDNVERIEVIRGPGATLWGANAVNGVINIITKKAKDTQGGLVIGGGGTEERGFGGVRYGSKLGDNADYRVYAKYFNRDNAVDASGNATADEWDALRGGFRVDWDISNSDSLTLQGDTYDGKSGQTYRLPDLTPPFTQVVDEDTNTAGTNVLGRWTRTLSETSDMVLQLYYDRTDRQDTVSREIRDTFDLDFQHRFGVIAQQEIVWGAGYRFTTDEFDGSFTVLLDPDSRDDHLFSAFVQDDITLLRNRLHITVGSKFEHNDYTGFEIQPNARLLWTVHGRNTIWGAISRAVRTPTRAEHDVRSNNQILPPGALSPQSPLAITALIADRSFESEVLLAYELGYRVQPTDRSALAITMFYNVYDDLRTFEPGTPFPENSPPPPHLVVPLFGRNKMDGETYGGEFSADWYVLDKWCLHATYAYLQMKLHLDEDSKDTMSARTEGESPHHQFSLRSSMDLPGNIEFDLGVRYVDNLPSLDLDSYLSLDARLGWKLREDTELFIVGQNLLDNHHPEFTPEILDSLATEVERSGYGGATWRF